MSKRSRLSRGISQVRNVGSMARHSRMRRHENPAMQTMMYNPRRIACERVAEQRRELQKAREPTSPVSPTSRGSEPGSKISKTSKDGPRTSKDGPRRTSKDGKRRTVTEAPK